MILGGLHHSILLFSTHYSSFSFCLADPAKARGCSTNTIIIDSFCQWVTLFLTWLYCTATPKQLEIMLPVINRLSVTGLGHSNSLRSSKSYDWFKSYGNFLNGIFCLLAQLHQEGSPPTSCAAGLFFFSYSHFFSSSLSCSSITISSS